MNLSPESQPPAPGSLVYEYRVGDNVLMRRSPRTITEIYRGLGKWDLWNEPKDWGESLAATPELVAKYLRFWDEPVAS